MAQEMPQTQPLHVWEMKEICLTASQEYENPYTDVDCWVELTGPDFHKRVYGFWDGENRFKVRIVATKAGEWQWISGSNQCMDTGLHAHSGSFTAIDWSECDKQQNPLNRGFITASANGHALQYADGTPFFLLGDTWLAASTWRLPFRNALTDPSYQPGPGIGFEEAVQYRKSQGFNSVSMIAAFPNWDSDIHPSTYADARGVYLRNAWEKFGYDVSEAEGLDASGGRSYWGTFTAKNMRDELGNLPFGKSKTHPGVSDFDRINPDYFRSLDQKMRYLNEQGFIPLLETIRRDAAPSWAAYYEFNSSYARYVQYLVARYGAFNFIFSKIHLDWIPKDFSLTAKAFNEALTFHLETYGPMPFGQPVTVLINDSTYLQFGHAEEVPWLTMHSVGNKPRDHRVALALETEFQLDPPYPTINFEPYYTGWDHEINKPGGERPPADSERDNYFARAQMYGSVLSGGLSGHVHGTAAYDLTSTGEPAGARPHFWDALRYKSADFMRPLGEFFFSEGSRYQQLELARQEVVPNEAACAPPDGLDGWTYMMKTPDGDLALLYFEHEAPSRPAVHHLCPSSSYDFLWFNPESAQWSERVEIFTDEQGNLDLPDFPTANDRRYRDWAGKLCKKLMSSTEP